MKKIYIIFLLFGMQAHGNAHIIPQDGTFIREFVLKPIRWIPFLDPRKWVVV